MDYISGVFFLAFIALAQLWASIYLMPSTWPTIVRLVGNRMRRSSNTRRELLLARTATETRAHEAEHARSNKDDDDWEKIAPTVLGSARNGGKGDSEWAGVVGFFHPFWYI